MADPQTANVGAYQPPTGSDVGTWAAPVNANTGTMDSLAANVAIIPLSSAPVTLTVPPNSGGAWSGPYQSQSGILRFTGALANAVTVTLPRAGFFIVENLCTGFYVILASSAPGNTICAPPGEATHIYCDGVNVKYVDFGRIGSYMDLSVSAVPAWITNCTTPPYLNCDGSAFSAVTFPTLAVYLGGTTLPDLRGRTRAALNQTTGRITTAGGGVDGNTLLSAGGAQNQTIGNSNLPASIPFTDPGHTHTGVVGNAVNTETIGGGQITPAGNAIIGTSTTGITINPGSPNTPLVSLPPITIAGLTLIRAG